MDYALSVSGLFIQPYHQPSVLGVILDVLGFHVDVGATRDMLSVRLNGGFLTIANPLHDHSPDILGIRAYSERINRAAVAAGRLGLDLMVVGGSWMAEPVLSQGVSGPSLNWRVLTLEAGLGNFTVLRSPTGFSPQVQAALTAWQRYLLDRPHEVRAWRGRFATGTPPQLFVRGVWTTNLPTHAFSYNVGDLQELSATGVAEAIRRFWASTRDLELMREFLRVAAEDPSAEEYSIGFIPDEENTPLWRRAFLEVFGEDATLRTSTSSSGVGVELPPTVVSALSAAGVRRDVDRGVIPRLRQILSRYV